MKELDRKYQLTERGAFCVSTFLKSKIEAGNTKIRWDEDMKGFGDGSILFEVTRDSCMRSSAVTQKGGDC